MLELRNEDLALLADEDLMREGTVIGFQHGYPGLMVAPGQFVVKDHKGDDTKLSVECHERKRGKMSRKKVMRFWDNKTHADVAIEVLRENGFPDSAIDVEGTEEVIETVTQNNEHDFQFLYRLASLNSFGFWLDGDGAHWRWPVKGKKPSRLLRYVKNMVGVGEIISFSFDGVAAGIPGRIKLSGIDSSTKKVFEVTSQDEKEVDLVEPYFEGGVEEGDRSDQGDSGNEVATYTGAATAEEAQRQANAMYTAAKRAALELTLVCKGDPTLRSRTIIEVWGIGTAIDGMYWVETAEHIHASTYTTQMKLTRKSLAKRLKIRGGSTRSRSMDDELRQILYTAGGALRQYYGLYGEK
jgi:phage protein D